MSRLALHVLDIPAQAQSVLPPGTKAYSLGDCRVFVSRDEIGEGRDVGLLLPGRWHLSISHPDRYPTWDEIVEARDRLLPDELHFCMGLPPRDFWLSVHPNCLHLWEIRDHALTDQWEFEGRGVQGTPWAGHKPRNEP